MNISAKKSGGLPKNLKSFLQLGEQRSLFGNIPSQSYNYFILENVSIVPAQ